MFNFLGNSNSSKLVSEFINQSLELVCSVNNLDALSTIIIGNYQKNILRRYTVNFSTTRARYDEVGSNERTEITIDSHVGMIVVLRKTGRDLTHRLVREIRIELGQEFCLFIFFFFFLACQSDLRL